MLRVLKKLVFILVFLELAYVLVLNSALNVEITQKLINKIKPEKFQITWEKAWTPYPFKVFLEKGTAWGASSSKKWKVDVKKASASISLLPLLKHRVKVYDIDAVDVNYFQRPVKIDAKTVDNRNAEKEAFFPPMKSVSQNVETTIKSVSKKKKRRKEKKPWKIDLENIVATGEHSFWIMHAKGELHGEVHVRRLSIETKSGPFSVEGGRLDVLMRQLQVGKEKEMLSQSKINGTVTIDPIVFSENKGMKMLSFISFDTDISTQMGNFDVLNMYLKSLKDASMEGKGRLDGHIHFQKGKLLQGTDIHVNADALSLHIKEYTVKGTGKVSAKVSSKNNDVLDANVKFDTLQGYVNDVDNASKEVLLFRGDDLNVVVKGGTSLLAKKKTSLQYFLLDIPSVLVDDLSVFQRYIPQKWAFNLQEGSGTFYARSLIEKGKINFDVQLRSSKAKVGLGSQIFKTNLDLFLKFNAQIGKLFKADLSGSYLSLKDSKIIALKNSKKHSKSWDTRLSIDESTFSMPISMENNLTKDALKSMNTLDIKKLLSTADATLKVTGEISQFDWLNMLIKNSLNLSFSGQGKIKSDLKLKQGALETGSMLSIIPKDLDITLLDYAFSGDGHFLFTVTKGGVKPTVAFDMSLKNALMKRRNEKRVMINKVTMKLSGQIKELDLKADQKEMDIRLQIPSAKVTNIAVYNSYIPKNSPFKLTSGTADMSADIVLSPNNAKGYVKLNTHGLTMKVDDQKISARLKMDIKISSGTPKNMAFNIGGSKIVLDQAKILGSTVQYKQPDWSAVVKLDKANVVWRKPIKLQSQISLKIKDSRPIIAMMDNKKEKHNWMSKLMTIEDIHGNATVNMANNVITFPYAFVKSDKIDIGAKGIISPQLRDGVFFLRYKKLKLLLKLRNGRKNLDIFHVKKTFDNYVIPSR